MARLMSVDDGPGLSPKSLFYRLFPLTTRARVWSTMNARLQGRDRRNSILTVVQHTGKNNACLPCGFDGDNCSCERYLMEYLAWAYSAPPFAAKSPLPSLVATPFVPQLMPESSIFSPGDRRSLRKRHPGEQQFWLFRHVFHTS